MKREGESSENKSFITLELKMKARGFKYAGLENLTRVKFDRGLFKSELAQSRSEIISKYTASYRKQGLLVEIELIDQQGLQEAQKAVFVFVKILEEIES